jgi:diguanylate cyclase (GGDEF)-like protein/PAS domain S-box-containing protein
MPLSRDRGLSNLFTALEGVAPELRHLVAEFPSSHGVVCDGMRIQVSAGVCGKSDPQFLSLTLLKLDAVRLMVVLNDVTLQVKRERLLKQSEAWFNAILPGITDYALVSLDARGRIDDWNETIRRVTGFSREAALGRSYAIFYPEDAMSDDRVLDRMREADQNGWSLDDGWRVRADGSRFWGSAMIAPLRDPHASRSEGSEGSEEPAYCLVIRDITDKREAGENLRRSQSADHLTGIANRRTFFEAGEVELERRRRAPRAVSMILFDADHFKRVNDTYGHAAGDAVLRNFAATLTRTFRQLDIVARVGGEEFAVLVPSTDQHHALMMAERLRRAVEAEAVEYDGKCIRYTVSGGVAQMDDSLSGLDALMKRADEALYAAKTGGRNRIVSWSAA